MRAESGWGVYYNINNRMLNLHFMTKQCKVSVIVVYTPVEPTDGDSSY